MPRLALIYTMVICLIGAAGPKSLAQAESKKPVIEKWCSNQDQTIHFTNVEMRRQGYSQCGKIKTPAMCDPLGNKYFGPSDTAPRAYRDCRIRPRIYVERNGRPVDVSKALRPDDDLAAEVKAINTARKKKKKGIFSKLKEVLPLKKNGAVSKEKKKSKPSSESGSGWKFFRSLFGG